MNAPQPASPAVLRRARRKAYVRLLPLLFVCYVIAYIDRTNVSIAKFSMARALPGFDEAVIGFGAGIFFLGYFILEVPGAVLAERWSARKWIARIMITWGFVAAFTAFVETPREFYFARFVLGLAEAGFFPGVVVYLTHWFTARDRAKAFAFFFFATPIAQLISPKICYYLLQLGGTSDGAAAGAGLLGLAGWQWIYVACGLPAVALAFVVLLRLPDRPRDARWLSAEERDALNAELERERAPAVAAHGNWWNGLRHPRALALGFAYFCAVTGSYGVEFFLPSILRAWHGLEFAALTTLIMIPAACSLVGQLFVAWNSDRTRERVWHAAVPLALAALSICAAPLFQSSLTGTLVCLVLAMTGLKAFLPAFWTLPNLFLAEVAAAASIGLINSLGNLGGFAGPVTMGLVQDWTGSYVGGLLAVGGVTALAAVLIVRVGRLRDAPRVQAAAVSIS